MPEINNNIAIYDNLGLSRSNEPKVEQSKEDQFMQLLIAQLKNQDPLQPQENGEFLSQLAQFETAAGAEELQKSFDTFSTNMMSASALQASSLVGRSVLAPGGIAQLEAGQNYAAGDRVSGGPAGKRFSLYNPAPPARGAGNNLQ